MKAKWYHFPCLNNCCWFHCTSSKHNCANPDLNKEDREICGHKFDHKMLLNEILGKKKADKKYMGLK